MKKSTATQELVNIYPPWARVRSDDQSVGYQLLNTMGRQMEEMDKYLARQLANNFLVTANLDEIDLTYRSVLPASFTFDTDTSDPVVTVTLAPTVSGLLNGVWRDVELAPENDIKSFWYDSYPDRASLAATLSGVDHDMLNFTASGLSVSGVWDHHAGGGRLYVECVGGTQYISIEDNQIHRGKVTIHGRTREDVDDTETMVFPWDMIQPTLKEWKSITKVVTRDIEDEVEIYVTSANFNNEDYISPWNLAYSDNRNKVDEFFGLGVTTSGSTLDRIRYVSDEWQQLIRGFIEKDEVERWQLLDDAWQPVSGVDMALQPFSDRAWLVTQSGLLYCYSTDSLMVSGVDYLKSRTRGTHVQIETASRWVLLGDDIEFTPWHARPLQEILKYRIWYQTPGGVKWLIEDGVPTTWDSRTWVVGQQLQRNIASDVIFTAVELGEYLLGLDVQYLDGTTDSERVLVSVNSKLPLTAIDLTSLITEDIEGIDFDSDQRMWVKTADQYHRLDLHTDVMIVDYEQKIIYFKEPYEQVTIETDG